MVMRGLLADQLRGAMHDKTIDMISFRRPYLAEQMRQTASGRHAYTYGPASCCASAAAEVGI
jgi:hypothetical protein